MKKRHLALTMSMPLIFAGCATSPLGEPTHKHGHAGHGGFYQNDGPPAQKNIDLSTIPKAIPKVEPRSKTANPRTYTALGKTYHVMKSARGFTQTGIASWYGRQFNGHRTASGEPYNMLRMTAAHKRLPIPCYVRVTNLNNGKHVVVRINDRGPFHKGRIIDLSYVAARRLGMAAAGSAPVRIRAITPGLTSTGLTSKRVNRPPSPRTQSDATDAIALEDGNKTASRALNNPSTGALFLQTGAFRHETNAKRQRAILENLHIRNVKVLKPERGLGLYRVQIGPFQRPDRRNRTRRKLRNANIAATNETR